MYWMLSLKRNRNGQPEQLTSYSCLVSFPIFNANAMLSTAIFVLFFLQWRDGRQQAEGAAGPRGHAAQRPRAGPGQEGGRLPGRGTLRRGLHVGPVQGGADGGGHPRAEQVVDQSGGRGLEEVSSLCFVCALIKLF